jgi:hypothetical protein
MENIYYEIQDLKNEESILENRIQQVLDDQQDGWRLDIGLIQVNLELVRDKLEKLVHDKNISFNK